jgi:hypothetical protein
MNNIVENIQPPVPFAISSLSSVDQAFRQWFQERDFWSIKAERLFIYFLQQPQMPMPVTNQHQQLLKQVIEDANNKINIPERYPAFFRDLLQHATLRHEFMTTVDAMNASFFE